MKQDQLDSLRVGAELGKGMTLADVQKAPDRQVLGLYLMMSDATLKLVDEVERLQRINAAVLEVAREHRKRGEASVRDDRLTSYETDHQHERLVEVGAAMSEIIETIEKEEKVN